jgi:hypothetical protein
LRLASIGVEEKKDLRLSYPVEESQRLPSIRQAAHRFFSQILDRTGRSHHPRNGNAERFRASVLIILGI